MTLIPAEPLPAQRPSIWKILTTKRMLIALLMGFYSGLPLLLTSRTLQAWMTEAQVDLKTIGLFALVGNPYALKFLWAPIFDRYVPLALGRRKGWILITQIGLALSILGMAFTDPLTQTVQLAACALMTAFFSASQDTVLDAYRRESLADLEFGLGTSLFVGGYRSAMWMAQAPAIALSLILPWSMVYTIAAVMVGVGMIVTLWAPEPTVHGTPPRSLQEAVVEPLKDFFQRRGAVLILLFILAYKVGDAFAGNMLMSFYLSPESLYTKEEMLVFAKTYSFVSTLLGIFLGGTIILKIGVYRSLWTFGLLQAVSTMGFWLLAVSERSLTLFGAVIFFEDFSSGLGTAAFVAFMGTMTNKKFTATQYALLTSLSAVPRSLLAAPAGWAAMSLGWPLFFMIGALAAIPGLALIPAVAKLQRTVTEEEILG